MKSDDLTKLAEILGPQAGLSHWQMGLGAAKSAKFFRDLKAGTRKGCTVATYNRVIQWFSAHWPADLPWPSDIPRPESSEPADKGRAA